MCAHFLGSSAGKESACNAGDTGSIPGSGISPGEGKGYPLKYSGLENSMDCIVDGVAKSRTQLFLTAYLKIFLCKQSQLIILTIFSQMDKNEKTKSKLKSISIVFSSISDLYVIARWTINL